MHVLEMNFSKLGAYYFFKNRLNWFTNRYIYTDLTNTDFSNIIILFKDLVICFADLLFWVPLESREFERYFDTSNPEELYSMVTSNRPQWYCKHSAFGLFVMQVWSLISMNPFTVP